MSFSAKNELVQARQLEVQEVNVIVDVVTAKSDAPSLVTIANGAIAASVITIDLKEALDKVISVTVTNRATGANLVIAGAPVISGSTVAVTVNGTGATDHAVCVKYKVKK